MNITTIEQLAKMFDAFIEDENNALNKKIAVVVFDAFIRWLRARLA
jgi:hypothetical protein